MIIIFAESGKGTSIDNDSVPTLSSLKEYLYTRTNIPIDQQILLSPSGIQTKDTNYAPTLSTDTFILFNRQHLERNNDLLSSSDNKSGTLQQEAWLNTLVDKHMPVMVDTSPLTRHYTALTSLVNKYKQRQQDWSNLECTTFCHQWIKTIQRFAQEVANISSQHGLLADTVTQELKMQTMALKAALSNLDNHIKSTYHSQTKFERIAKKKLAKHTQSMALVDRDLSFMHEIKLHSQIQTPLCSPPFESQLQYLIDCFSITPMASLKAQLQEDYDRLVKKTHQLNDKMKTIYRQSQQINIQHTGKATLGDIQSYLTMINDVWHHLELRWKRLDDDERMKHIIGDTVNRMEQQMYFLNDSGTNDSREYKDDDTNTEMESTIKKTDITDIPDEDLAKRLLLYESFIRTALETILEEKRNVMVNFFRYLQTISHLEESIANLFLSLRHLGNDIKQLGQRTEQLETVSNGIIEGYGLMLIELWRRNQYHQIISKNADLLTGLFSAFASSERQYRAKFQTDICMIDGLESLLLGNTKIKDNICIIPFIYKDFINDEPSCTTIPALDITLAPQHQTPSDRNNKAIVLLEPPLICKKDVEEFIDLMQSYYTNFQGFQGHSNDKMTVNVMVQRLSERLDRESRRLTHGLIKLGLPSNKVKKDVATIYSTPPSSASSLPSTTLSTSTASTTTTATMQVQPSHNLPFASSLAAKKEWGTSSIYAQVQQQQDMKAKIESLEQKLKHDHEVFEKQRSVLLEEIKMKDNQLVEKQKQWESQWSTKMEEIQQQLEMQQKVHENDILEWKTRYQEALDTEQEKHHRRLAYFHERLTAKNVEYAQLEQQLVQSAPTSPVQQQQHIVPVSIDKKKMEDNETTHRWRRSASLNDGPMKRPVIITPANNLRLETVLPRPNMFNKDERYAQELQDMTLRHQAAMDNMISEYEETRMELLAQHAREKEVWKIEQDAQLQEACTTLAQEHGAILDHVNQAWQQKWDDLKRDQLVQKQQWDQQLDAAKLEWESRHAKEQAELKKQLSWSKGELHMMLKEHETALRLAKQLNLIIDHTIDVDDMKFTLLGLLEVGIKHASRLDTQTYLVEKASEPFFGFMNLSFF